MNVLSCLSMDRIRDVFDMLDEVHVKPDVYLSTFDSFTAIAMIEKGLGIKYYE